jgi:hypothetical protein
MTASKSSDESVAQASRLYMVQGAGRAMYGGQGLLSITPFLLIFRHP